MKILWVEDGGASLQASMVSQAMFGELFPESFFDNYKRDEEFQDALPQLFADAKEEGTHHEIVICRSFDDWLNVSQSDALDFDVALLDINLERFAVPEPPIEVEDFARRAGLFIYHQLREEHGMAAENIAFFSGEAATMSDFQSACAKAMLRPPRNLFEKKTEHYARVSQWLKSLAGSPYQRLRRAILDGCHHLTLAISQVDEDSLARSFGLFRPSNPRLWDNWGAYRDQIEQYHLRLRRALPMSEPLDAASRYQDVARELTSLWQGVSDLPKILLPEEGAAKADELFARSSQRILRLANDWASRDLLADTIAAEDVAFLAILAARSWGPWSSSKPETFELPLLSLLPDAEEPSVLRARLEREGEDALSQSYKQLVAQARSFSGQRQPTDFLSNCEALSQELKEADAEHYDKVRSQSLPILHQAFWHALTPASVDPVLFFKVQEFSALGLIEELGRRIYRKSFPEPSKA